MMRRHAIACVIIKGLADFLQADAWSPRPQIYDIAAKDGLHHKSLYPKDGPVEVLVGDVKMDDDVIWLVEYYDVNCPHCWVFSSEYPLIAKALGSSKVRVASRNCVDMSNLAACSAAGAVKYPTLKVYNAKKPGDSAVVHIHGKSDPMDPIPASEIAQWLSKYSEGKIKIQSPSVLQSGANFKDSKGILVKPDGPPGVPGWSREPFGSVQTRFHDAHVGLAQLLMDGYVSKEKYKAALEVVDFVSKAWGKDESKVFDELKAKLKAKSDLEPLEFKRIVSDWISKFNKAYIFCQTETCSVWQLFHGISVLIAIKYAPITVEEALPMYRFMVNEFLSCDACRVHFVESYDRCLFGRCEVLKAGSDEAQAKALVLWLWRTHNAVSVRVISEHHFTPPIDRRWPNYKDCPGCWETSVVSGSPGKLMTFAGQKDKSGKLGQCYDIFNEDKVFGFLLFTYLGEQPKTEAEVKAIFKDIAFLSHSPTEKLSFPAIALAACAIVAAVALLLVARRRTDAGREPCRRTVTAYTQDEFFVDEETIE